MERYRLSCAQDPEDFDVVVTAFTLFLVLPMKMGK